WAAVLRPTSGLGERLAWSTGISMASVPTVAVILARVTRDGVALWVALAAVLIVFGSGLLVYWRRGPAPGTAAPVLRMPEPIRDPRVLGLTAVAIALGLLMMPARRPPVLVLAVSAVALIVGGGRGGAMGAWPGSWCCPRGVSTPAWCVSTGPTSAAGTSTRTRSWPSRCWRTASPPAT